MAGFWEQGSNLSDSVNGEGLVDTATEFRLLKEDFRDRDNYLGT